MISFVIGVFIVLFLGLLVPGKLEPSTRGAPKKMGNLIWLTPFHRSGDRVKRCLSEDPALSGFFQLGRRCVETSDDVIGRFLLNPRQFVEFYFLRLQRPCCLRELPIPVPQTQSASHRRVRRNAFNCRDARLQSRLLALRRRRTSDH